jgi:hypothetical protein
MLYLAFHFKKMYAISFVSENLSGAKHSWIERVTMGIMET